MTTRRFALLALLIVALAVIRSAIATRLDGFTIDEPYHITAGVAYVTKGDYRLNPEHPPLVKLWVGSFVAPIYHLPPLRKMDSKIDERDFHESAMFLGNDADAVQRRSRVAMLLFHAILLLTFGFAVRRLLGAGVAIGALVVLAIDPTVAAHMPVVMTDLPIALTASTALLCAVIAFRSWRAVDLVIATITAGLMLGAKHNGIVAMIVIAAIGAFAALRRDERFSRLRRAVSVAVVLLGAVAILWGLYGFRYAETAGGTEAFNTPLQKKISALHTPLFRSVLTRTDAMHLLPRAYTWGLADVLRAGVEGRDYPFALFGYTFIGHTPFYYFPTIVALKLPLGILALILLAAIGPLSPPRGERGRGEGLSPLIAIAALLVAFLATLMLSNSGYAGVRHALPAFPPLAIFAGLALASAYERRTRVGVAAASIALVAAIVSAVPVIRPWEYFNEVAGGPTGAWRKFSDEGTDLGQRVPELAAFYAKAIKPTGQPAFDEYGVLPRDRERRRMTNLQSFGDTAVTSDIIDGWIVIQAPSLQLDIPWADFTPLLRTKPVARFGNLMIYRGRFRLPWVRAQQLFLHAIYALQGRSPNLPAIEKEMTEAAAIVPRVYPMQISLGNVRAKLGRRDEALAAFLMARRYAPSGAPLVTELDQHMARLRREAPQSVPSLTNPWAE